MRKTHESPKCDNCKNRKKLPLIVKNAKNSVKYVSCEPNRANRAKNYAKIVH